MLCILTSTEHEIYGQRWTKMNKEVTTTNNPNPASNAERLFLNSLPSPYTQRCYKVYLSKYLDHYGMKNVTDLLSKDHKQIENQIIEFIITSKEKGMRRSAISNYTNPVISFCKINDVMLNTTKINKFMPSPVKTKKTYGYNQESIQKLLDIADERMRCVIYVLSSVGCRIGALPSLSVGNLEEVNYEGHVLYKITIYENEPEEYTSFCTTECKTLGIDPYLQMRRRYGEIITDSSPLVREQFDRRDQFAIAHPQRIKESSLAIKLTDLAEAAGLRTKVRPTEGQHAASAEMRNVIPRTNGYRRYYCGVLADSGLLTERRWLLEGHALKGNDSSYLKITTDDLLKSYMLAHDNLLISQEHRLKERCEKLEVERSEIQTLHYELEKLKQAIGTH